MSCPALPVPYSQTQKKLEDIAAASAAAGVPDLRIPINCVTKGASPTSSWQPGPEAGG